MFFFIRLSCPPFFHYFSVQFWLLPDKLPSLSASTLHWTLPTPFRGLHDREKRPSHLFSFSWSTCIANPNPKSKWDLRFNSLTLTHEDPCCSFCPINLGYALAAATLRAVFWGIKMNILRNRLFHQFRHHFPTDAICSVPCHWKKAVLWQNAI